MRLPDDVSVAGSRGLPRTRAGLGSGLEVVIPSASRLKDEIWVNVPVVERFAQSSPYHLTAGPAGYAIVDDRNAGRYPVRLPAAPEWYSRLTSRGVPMNRIGVMQGTYLAIYVNPVCAFWKATPRLSCQFCTTGLNVGVNEAPEKALSDVVETCRAAKDESGITFVHFNGGFQGQHGLEFIKPYVNAVKEDVGLLVGVQLAPERHFKRYDELVALGVDHLSFCIELFDPDWFARICPGKAREHGQKLYFDAMSYCVDLLPYGAVSGEIIAGLEPIARTLEAIDRIASLGAFPTVCIFRPTIGSDLENWPSPSYNEMRWVMEHMYAACRRALLPIGIAPNVEVSLVVNPDDAAMLAERTLSFYSYEAYRRVVRLAARGVFHQRMRTSNQ
jgi:hypothetical protein